MLRATSLGALAWSARAIAGTTPSPKDAYLYILWPADGQRIHGAFWCRFGLRGMGVTRAGDVAPDMGHHHLLIDGDADFDTAAPIPADKKHVHFGAGQTEGRIDLPPGKHTLQLVLGDANHVTFDPPVVSRKVTVFIY